MQRHITHIFICIFIIFISFPIFSQTEEQSKGNWLISRTPPTINTNKEEKKEQFENFAKLINSLLENNITPQALDRNTAGEMILLSQTAPPAQLARNWILQSYKDEKTMLKDIENKSQERIYPTGLDIQQDGAYVLFLQSQLTMKRFRLIKVETQKILIKSINDYLDLGFIPIAMSSFNETIWVMFASFKEILTDTVELQITSTSLDNLGNTLNTVLQDSRSQIRSFTTINTDTFIVIQHKK